MPTLNDVYKAGQNVSVARATQGAIGNKLAQDRYQLAQSLYKQNVANTLKANGTTSGSLSGYGNGATAAGFGGAPLTVIGGYSTISPQGIAEAKSDINQGYAAGNEYLRTGEADAAALVNKALGEATQTREKGLAATLKEIGIGVDRSAGALAKLTKFGEDAISKLSVLAGLGAGGTEAQQSAQEALTVDPGYQFRLEQGQKAVRQGLAARGLGGGQYDKALADYSQGLASQEFANTTNRLMNIIGVYSPVAQQQASTEYQAGLAKGQFTGQVSENVAQSQTAASSTLAQLKTSLAQQLYQSEIDKASVLANYAEKANTNNTYLYQQGNNFGQIVNKSNAGTIVNAIRSTVGGMGGIRY